MWYVTRDRDRRAGDDVIIHVVCSISIHITCIDKERL